MILVEIDRSQLVCMRISRPAGCRFSRCGFGILCAPASVHHILHAYDASDREPDGGS